MNLKTPLKLVGGKPNAFGFGTGQIVDADNNCVFSGAFRDRETAEGIVNLINSTLDARSAMVNKYKPIDVHAEDRITTPAPQKPS